MEEKKKNTQVEEVTEESKKRSEEEVEESIELSEEGKESTEADIESSEEGKESTEAGIEQSEEDKEKTEKNTETAEVAEGNKEAEETVKANEAEIKPTESAIEASESAVKAEDTAKKKIIIAVAAALLIALIAIVVSLVMSYQKKVTYYETHYFPNTYINNVNCSELEAEQVAGILNAQAQEYTLLIQGRDEAGNKIEVGQVHAEDINLLLSDALGAAKSILEEQDETRWYAVKKDTQHSYNISQGVKFDEDLLKEILENFDACREENMVAPVDAYISEISEEKTAYEIIPEIKGTTLDVDAVYESIAAALYANADAVDLAEQGCYIEPAVVSEDEDLLSTVNEVNKWLSTSINYDWNSFDVKLDIDVIKNWISLVEGTPVLDEEAVAAFVAENAAKYDTYGKNRQFMTTLGVELNLPSGAFGWRTDREKETEALIELIKQGSVTDREPEYSHKAPWKGISDIGNSYVEADLTNQHLYLYYKGELVLETDFVSGDINVPGNVTPQGVFGLTYKTTNAVLRGADYETPVTYWMPFHGNFGMHDATWRTEFGGDIYTYNGSHGCLNLPLESAAVIYSYMYEGYPVICYYY